LRRRRWRSRAPRMSSRKKMVILVLVVFLLVSVQTFVFIDRNLKPPLVEKAKILVKQMATQAINAAITDRISQGTDFDKLIDWKTDNTGKITGFMLNYAEHMRITSETISTVQKSLEELQEKPGSIPVGEAFDSPILASFGPKMPVRFVPEGAAKVELGTRYQNAGINMILVEVYIHVIVEMMVVVPFDTQPDIVETEIPVSYVLVVGDVPTYYFDNKGNPVGSNAAYAPNLSLPDLNMNSATPGAAPAQGQGETGSGRGGVSSGSGGVSSGGIGSAPKENPAPKAGR